MKLTIRWRTGLLLLTVAAALAAAAIGFINWTMKHQAEGRLFTAVPKAPANDVALVLGTAPMLAGGRRANLHFENRLDAAAALYHEGKVRHLLVSGDNSRKDYDEPTAMRAGLQKRGVPDGAITRDYAGFRTLDSVVRARAVFGQSRLTIVSDDFHLPRALFLAEANGIAAVGFASPRVPDQWSRKTRVREIGARVAAWLDVSLLRTEPKFYGPPVAIHLTPGG